MIAWPLFLLKVSRPGLWFQTLWLYLLPTAARPDLLRTAPFWIGVAYVLFPLNFLVYGWNDLVDADIDRLNPRKDSFLFGARGNPGQLRRLPPLMAGCQAGWLAILAVMDWRLGAILAAITLVNAMYNLPGGMGLRGRPPFELINQIGYLLILPLGAWLNRVALPPPAAFGYLVLFCTHSHLVGEIMDIAPDRAAGRSTSAVWLGARASKAIVIALVIGEGILLCTRFRDYILGGFLLMGTLWLAFDLCWNQARAYTRFEFHLFGLGLNAAGFASMAWVWETGTLLRR